MTWRSVGSLFCFKPDCPAWPGLMNRPAAGNQFRRGHSLPLARLPWNGRNPGSQRPRPGQDDVCACICRKSWPADKRVPASSRSFHQELRSFHPHKSSKISAEPKREHFRTDSVFLFRGKLDFYASCRYSKGGKVVLNSITLPYFSRGVFIAKFGCIVKANLCLRVIPRNVWNGAGVPV